MRLLSTTRTVALPNDVEVHVHGRQVRVKGPRGELFKDLSHIAVDMYLIEDEGVKKLRVDKHFGTSKQQASLRTVTSHVENLIVGVTKGFEYKMRLVYAHFPINVSIEDNGTRVEIRNFLGEKRVRVVPALPGVTVVRDGGVKDQLVISGNSIEHVGRTCALIHQSCLVKKKDIRKFLDGVYVSEKGNIVKEE